MLSTLNCRTYWPQCVLVNYFYPKLSSISQLKCHPPSNHRHQRPSYRYIVLKIKYSLRFTPLCLINTTPRAPVSSLDNFCFLRPKFLMNQLPHFHPTYILITIMHTESTIDNFTQEPSSPRLDLHKRSSLAIPPRYAYLQLNLWPSFHSYWSIVVI